MSAQNELDDVVHIDDGKPSLCYGCGQKLQTFSMLICAECLDSECGKFAKLAEAPNKRKKK